MSGDGVKGLHHPLGLSPLSALMPRVLASFAVVLLLVAGCAEYHVGVGSLFRPDVRTIGVQMFDSLSYRRYLGERLTEAVVKEIERRTPYKVVDADRADVVLTGVIIRDDKDLLLKSPIGGPRIAKMNMGVQVTWSGRTTTLPLMTEVNDGSQFLPEMGHSVATGQQEAIRRLAREIVNLMEIDPLPGVDGPPPGLVLPEVTGPELGRLSKPPANGSLPGVSISR